MNALLRKPHVIVIGLCGWFMLLALVYSANTPPFEAPDEAAHFLYAHNIVASGGLPILEDRDTVFASLSVERHQAPLYYMLGAGLLALTQRDDLQPYLDLNPLSSIGFVSDNNENVFLHRVPAPTGDTITALRLFRLFSTFLGMGTIWFVYRSGRLATGDARIGLLAAFLVVSIPSFIHNHASINNDNLVTLLFSAGIFFCLRVWKLGLTRHNVFALGALTGCIIITKHNGFGLPAVIGLVFLAGLVTRRFRFRDVLLAGFAILGLAALLGGWWYVRNWQLYGDPLALAASFRIWNRGPTPKLISLFEAKGVWDSFWFVLGHLNIRGPEWLLSGYLPALVLVGVAGVGLIVRRKPRVRPYFLFMGVAVVIVVLTWLVVTSRMNTSQGRILFPTLAASAPLVMTGLVTLFGRRVAGIAVLPLAVMALLAPWGFLRPAFEGASAVQSAPVTMRPIHVGSDDLEIVGDELVNNAVDDEQWVRLTVYVRGTHPDNPWLFVTAIDPVTQAVYGGVDEYPGMMATDAMQPDMLYVVPVKFRLDTLPERAMRLSLVMGWRVGESDDPGEGRYLPLADAEGRPIDPLIVPGPAYVTTEAETPPAIEADITYGDLIHLDGLTLSAAQAGETLTASLHWRSLQATNEDWTVTFGLFDAQNNIIAQADGMPEGYPTSAWVPGTAHVDTRSLDLPADLPPGEYRLFVGWYRLSDDQRLPARGDSIENDLYLYPLRVE